LDALFAKANGQPDRLSGQTRLAAAGRSEIAKLLELLCSLAIRNGVFAHTGCILQAASRIAAGVAKTNLISGRADVILAWF
jgi:hypothetical protein